MVSFVVSVRTEHKFCGSCVLLPNRRKSGPAESKEQTTHLLKDLNSNLSGSSFACLRPVS